jgi:hypothetical protein
MIMLETSVSFVGEMSVAEGAPPIWARAEKMKLLAIAMLAARMRAGRAIVGRKHVGCIVPPVSYFRVAEVQFTALTSHGGLGGKESLNFRTENSKK